MIQQVGPLPSSALSPVQRPEISLTCRAVAALEEISLREVQYRVARGEYRAVPAELNGKNGRARILILLDSLSPEAQARYLAQVRDRETGIATSTPSAVPVLDRRLRGAEVPMTLTGAVDEIALRQAGRHTEADIYLRRRHAVARCLDLLGKSNPGEKGLAWKHLQLELNTPAETLRAWLRKYQSAGAVALVPGYGAARGTYPAIPQGLQRAILAVYRNQQRQTVSQIMRHVVRRWCEDHGHIAPSRSSVGRFISHEILAAEEVAFRIGRDGWQKQIAAKVVRSPEDLAVNDLWCADHRRLDVFVTGPDGYRVIRPWLTLYVDIRTAGFVGWCLRDRPTAQSVALALRAGMLKRGLPRVLYHDNGKEFISNRFGGKAARLTHFQIQNPQEIHFQDCVRWPALPPPAMTGAQAGALLGDLGIERIMHALPYHAWSKPIESMFHAFHAAWENLMPGYCGNTAEHKPEKLRNEMKQGRLLHWDQFAEIFRKHVDEWNSNHVCGERSRTPDQYYRAAEGDLRPAPEDRLDLLLLDSGRRKVQPQGIEIGGKSFLDEQLAYLAGEWVSVWWDPDNLSHIVVRPERNPNRRLVIAQIPHAGWFEYSQANLTTNRIQKLQREQIRAVAVSDREVLLPEYVDPSGANRLALLNSRSFTAEPSAPSAQAEGTRRTQRTTEHSLIADLKYAQDQEKKQRDEDRLAGRERKSVVAAAILDQARREEAHQKGEACPG